MGHKHPIASKTILFNTLLTIWAIVAYVNEIQMPPQVMLWVGLVNIWLRVITKGPVGFKRTSRPQGFPLPPIGGAKT